MADKMTNCVLAQCLHAWGKTMARKERMVSIYKKMITMRL
jgi:hypothetical protein